MHKTKLRIVDYKEMKACENGVHAEDDNSMRRRSSDGLGGIFISRREDKLINTPLTIVRKNPGEKKERLDARIFRNQCPSGRTKKRG